MPSQYGGVRQRDGSSKSTGRIFVVLSILALSVSLIGLALTNVDAVLLVTSIAILIAVVAPGYLRKNYGVFEPLTFVAISVLLGCTLKAFYLVLLAGSNTTVDEKLLLGLSLDSLVFGSYVLLAGFAAFSFGYGLVSDRRGLRSTRRRDKWSVRKLTQLSIAVVIISGLALVAFALRMNISIDGLDSLSAKRFRDDDGAVTASRTGTLEYVLYRIALLAKFPLYILFAYRLRAGFPLFSLLGWLLLSSGFLSIFVPFFVNNRAGVVLPVFDLLIISYMIRRKLDVKMIVTVGSVVTLLVLLGSVIRAGGELSGVYNQIFGGRYLVDVTKTAHIVNYYRDTGFYHYGATLVSWVFNLVPVTSPFDPDLANLGFFLGSEVFGYMGSGVPPGIVAEMFMNFGWYGVIVGMFVFGVVLRWFYLAYGTEVRDLDKILIYALVCTRFTVFLFNNGLSTAVLKTVLDLVALLGALWFIKARRVA